MKDSVELCQRFGRARQEERSIVVLDERRDRPLELLQSIHCLQHEIVQRFDPKNIKYDQEAEIAKQRQREASAYKSILVNRECYVSEPLKKLNEYTSKTKGNVDTLMEKTGNEFCCNLTYTNHLQESVNGSGMASSKQAAKSEAALEILDTLQQKYYHAGR